MFTNNFSYISSDMLWMSDNDIAVIHYNNVPLIGEVRLRQTKHARQIEI